MTTPSKLQTLYGLKFHPFRADIPIDSPSPVPRQEMNAKDIAVGIGIEKIGFVSPECRVAVKAIIGCSEAAA